MKSIVVVVAMNRKEIVFLAPFIKKTTRDQPSCKVVSEPSSADNAHIYHRFTSPGHIFVVPVAAKTDLSTYRNGNSCLGREV
jgi:3,4-dihydroxy-2-butanone 4-phosphate synthase